MLMRQAKTNHISWHAQHLQCQGMIGIGDSEVVQTGEVRKKLAKDK